MIDQNVLEADWSHFSTVFPLKPTYARVVAARYGFDLRYDSKPAAALYERWIAFVDEPHRHLSRRGSRDLLDTQSFIWMTQRYDPVPAH